MTTIRDNLVLIAELQGIPLRTLADVKANLDADAKRDPAIAKSMAALMLKHGRLTDDARAWIAETYPQ